VAAGLLHCRSFAGAVLTVDGTIGQRGPTPQDCERLPFWEVRHSAGQTCRVRDSSGGFLRAPSAGAGLAYYQKEPIATKGSAPPEASSTCAAGAEKCYTNSPPQLSQTRNTRPIQNAPWDRRGNDYAKYGTTEGGRLPL